MHKENQHNNEFHKKCKDQLITNMRELQSTWQWEPHPSDSNRTSRYWLHILAQPHVFLALHRIEIMLRVRQSLTHKLMYPPQHCILKAFTYTSPEEIKCVILCHDPYPSEQAMGLCLSAQKILPSLRRFFQVIYASYGFDYMQSAKPPTGDLEYLAQQGVLLLNSALTVEDKSSTNRMDHVRAWSPIIDAILTVVYQANPNCAFLAMGKPAKEALSTIESILKGKPETKRCWYEKHPSAWIKLQYIQEALKTFKKVREYLKRPENKQNRSIGCPNQYLNTRHGPLEQHQDKDDCINWMPYLRPFTFYEDVPVSSNRSASAKSVCVVTSDPILVRLADSTIMITEDDDGSEY